MLGGIEFLKLLSKSRHNRPESGFKLLTKLLAIAHRLEVWLVGPIGQFWGSSQSSPRMMKPVNKY
jgi:hypothetical protein